MKPKSFADDALLLIGHGSTRYPDAGRNLHAHAATLRTRGGFAEVSVGLLAGTPSAAQALAALTSDTVHVVPFFMEDGYFTRVAVPRALGSNDPGQTRRLRFLPPIGVHRMMPALLQRRVLRHCEAGGCEAGGREAGGCEAGGIATERLALLLVGHGSARAPGRVTALHRHAAVLREHGLFGSVHVAFLEEAPLVADALRSLQGETVGVLGFFAGEGGHVRDDLPGVIAAARQAADSRRREGCAAEPALHDFGTVGDLAELPEIITDLVMSSHTEPHA